MRILITVSYYTPHISGLTNSIKNLAEGLAEKGNAITVLTTQHKKNLVGKEVVHKVNVRRVPYLLKFQKGFIMPFYFFILIKQVWNNDVILINLPQPEGVLAAFFGRIFGKRVVSVYACEVSLPKSILALFIEQVLTFFHFITLQLSHKVVALSDDYANHAMLLRHFKTKTVGIYPYIKKPHVIAKRVVISSKKRYKIGYLGRISSEKGLEYLLQAVPLLQKQLGDNFVITLAGPKAVGEQQYVKRIETLAEKYKGQVSIMPPLADEEMGAFYANLDVLVLPSINSTEAFGMVQVEAMFCGTPVICSDLPGVRVPVMATGMGEIARKKDSEDLAQKIITVLKNRYAYAAKQSVVLELFDSEKVLKAYMKVLLS